jgi:hypothetical protein
MPPQCRGGFRRILLTPNAARALLSAHQACSYWKPTFCMALAASEFFMNVFQISPLR